MNPADQQSEGLILVVEDDARVSRFLVKGLREEGFTVDLCDSGVSAVEQINALPYELILLDWALPGRDGVNVLRHVRSSGNPVPVIMLTARSGVDATVLALDAGADDYVTKPFRFEELMARVRANVRRSRSTGQSATTIRVGNAQVDLRSRSTERSGKTETLSTREYELLDYLLKHRGEVISRARLLDSVWGLSHDPTTNVVDVYIRYLRTKLDGEGVTPSESCIETVRGRGYRLRERT